MLFLQGDDAGPSDPLTADLTPTFQVLGFVGAIVAVLALVVLVARLMRRRRQQSFPSALTVVALVGGSIGLILLVMSIGAGAVIA